MGADQFPTLERLARVLTSVRESSFLGISTKALPPCRRRGIRSISRPAATLDLAGVPSSFSTLAGGGTLTGSTTSLVTISGGYFSGNLTGYLNLDITGNVHLAGDSTIGNIDIGNGASSQP